MKTQLKCVSSESLTFADIDDLMQDCENVSETIPTARIEYENGESNLFANSIQAIHSAYLLKAVGKKIKLYIFNPEIMPNGNICITTNVYE